MAKGRKTGGRDFSPGYSGNPGGRPRLPDDLKAIRSTSTMEIERQLFSAAFATEAELQLCLRDTGRPVIEKILARGLLEAVRVGDFKRLHCLLDRLVGKVSQPVEVTPVRSFHSQLVDFIAMREEQKATRNRRA